MHSGLVFAVVKKVNQVRQQRLGHPLCSSLAPLSMVCDFKLKKESLDLL